MKLPVLPFLIFAIKLTHGSSNSSGLFRIPVPEIVTFKGGGLRVSIPADPGISEFKFRGMVNREIEPLRPGAINMSAYEETGGKWVLENRQVVLHRHDNISYWIYVKKDRLGYVKQPVVYTVKELVPYFIEPRLSTIPLPSQTDETSEQHQLHLNLTRSQVEQLANSYNNLTQLLDSVKSQVETLSQTATTLNKIVQETLLGTKKLTMSRRIPRHGGAFATAKFILWEKLDLQPKMISATRNKDGSIMFEVETLQEKIEVLKAARARLKSSKIVVS